MQYNPTAEYHLGLLRAEEQAKSGSKRKRPQSTVADEPVKPQVAEEDGEIETPGPTKPKPEPEPEPEQPPATQEQPPATADGPDRAMSPVSTASSASESPLAQRMKMNGGSHSKSAPPAPPESEQISRSESTSTQARVTSPPQASPSRLAPSAPPPAQNPPVGVGPLTACNTGPDHTPEAPHAAMADGVHGRDAGEIPGRHL